MQSLSNTGRPAPGDVRVRLVPGRAALLIVCALVSGCAGPASVRGLVVPPAGDSGPGSRGEHLDRAVVFAVPVRGKPVPAPLARAVIRQTTQGFEPRTLLVTENTEIDFVNRDRVYHNVFSPSPTMKFDVGRYGPGEKRTVLFDRVGVVRVFCEFHPNSTATVVVLPPRFTTRPRADGSFSLNGLPPGTYTLTVWHPDYGETSTTLHVPRSGGIRSTLAY